MLSRNVLCVSLTQFGTSHSTQCNQKFPPVVQYRCLQVYALHTVFCKTIRKEFCNTLSVETKCMQLQFRENTHSIYSILHLFLCTSQLHLASLFECSKGVNETIWLERRIIRATQWSLEVCYWMHNKDTWLKLIMALKTTLLPSSH